MDPLVEVTMQPYSAFNNYPIRYNDPTGMIAEDPGDIYNSLGEHIGNDGIDDHKVYQYHTWSNTQLSQKESLYLTQNINFQLSSVPLTEVNITSEELNTRAFLTTIRNAEADGNAPLSYDTQYGGGKFKGSDLNKDGNITSAEKFADHPREFITKWGLTMDVAGAYQFKSSSWDNVASKLGLSSFSGENQDKGALQLIRWQQQYNPRASGVIHDITSGNASSAFTKLNGTWTSLPGGNEELINSSQAKGLFNANRASELRGNSVIATPIGKLKF